MELVLNIADRYTGNIYASASQTLKGAGKTEQAAYNNAFQQQNIRNGKYKAMVEKAKGIANISIPIATWLFQGPKAWRTSTTGEALWAS